MPSRYNKNLYVKCPCFYRETSMEIKCKDIGDKRGGIGLAGESTVSCFGTKADKDNHKDDFCNGCYQGCEVYIALSDMIAYWDNAC